MQKYPKGIVLQLEKAGLSWSFETRRGGKYGKKTVVCHIVDRDSGKRVAEANGPDELTALQNGAKAASGVQKPPSDREMARIIAEQNAKIEALNSKLSEAEKPSKPKAKTEKPPGKQPEPAPVSD